MEDPSKPSASRLSRFSAFARGLSQGGDATSIGFVLVASIIAPCLLGVWLDNRLHTVYWTPILFLIGVVFGFRELFRTVAQMNARKSGEWANRKKGMATRPNEASSTEVEPPKPRAFNVPSPPQPSFAGGTKLETEPEAPAKNADLDDDLNAIRQLLKESRNAESDDRKPT